MRYIITSSVRRTVPYLQHVRLNVYLSRDHIVYTIKRIAHLEITSNAPSWSQLIVTGCAWLWFQLAIMFFAWSLHGHRLEVKCCTWSLLTSGSSCIMYDPDQMLCMTILHSLGWRSCIIYYDPDNTLIGHVLCKTGFSVQGIISYTDYITTKRLVQYIIVIQLEVMFWCVYQWIEWGPRLFLWNRWNQPIHSEYGQGTQREERQRERTLRIEGVGQINDSKMCGVLYYPCFMLNMIL